MGSFEYASETENTLNVTRDSNSISKASVIIVYPSAEDATTSIREVYSISVAAIATLEIGAQDLSRHDRKMCIAFPWRAWSLLASHLGDTSTYKNRDLNSISARCHR